ATCVDADDERPADPHSSRRHPGRSRLRRGLTSTHHQQPTSARGLRMPGRRLTAKSAHDFGLGLVGVLDFMAGEHMTDPVPSLWRPLSQVDHQPYTHKQERRDSEWKVRVRRSRARIIKTFENVASPHDGDDREHSMANDVELISVLTHD